MISFNLKKSNYVIEEEATLEQAMVAITLNQRGAVVVVDVNGVLLGIVSDGDIRRTLLRHATLIAPVSKALNMNVVFLSNKEDAASRSREIFREKTVVNIIPVVNEDNKVVDIIVRNPEVRKTF